ncbi:MAG TPA: hypothetical protein VNB90_14190 [Cytophagaceae bacterium]|jgi:hypothetical protein|nr:hypothetical protein [Cytophagaceae bacterium]
MKNQFQEYLNLVRGFMKKHYLFFISVKVLKFILVLFLLSCESKTGPSSIPDTVLVDTIQGNSPEDSVIYKNDDDDDDDKKEEDNNNPIAPEEGSGS